MEPADLVALARVQAVPPHTCAVYGEQAATTRAVVFQGAGPRWVDLCWDHGMAVRRRSRLPATLDGISADLRAAAREAGLLGAARRTSRWRHPVRLHRTRADMFPDTVAPFGT
jgi:hypothetical protein